MSRHAAGFSRQNSSFVAASPSGSVNSNGLFRAYAYVGVLNPWAASLRTHRASCRRGSGERYCLLERSANASDGATRSAGVAGFAAFKPILELCVRILLSRVDDPCSAHEARLRPDEECRLAVGSGRAQNDRGFSFDIATTCKWIRTGLNPLRWRPTKRSRRDPGWTPDE